MNATIMPNSTSRTYQPRGMRAASSLDLGGTSASAQRTQATARYAAMANQNGFAMVDMRNHCTLENAELRLGRWSSSMNVLPDISGRSSAHSAVNTNMNWRER